MLKVLASYESGENEILLLDSKLKIKRLQDITVGSGLNGADFDATLDCKLKNFFNEFRNGWNASRRNPQPQLKLQLKNLLLSSHKPLLLALKLFANCPDCANVKNKSFSHFIMETTCKVNKEHPRIGDDCDDNTRMIAYNFVKMSGILSLNKAIIETYQLHKIRHLLLMKLRELLDQGHYKETAQWAIQLDLAHEFDIFELSFPLLAQDKLYIAEELLDKVVQQRLSMVQFLDSLLHPEKPVIKMCEPILDRYKHVEPSLSILSYRPLSKLVARLAKKYNLDETVIPNFKFTKTCSYLHYLYREYNKGSMSIEAYRELVRDNATTTELQTHFVEYIRINGDYNEAIKWYTIFQLKFADCPHEIKTMISTNMRKSRDSNDERINNIISTDEDYLTLDVGPEAITIVNTCNKFEQMLSHLQHVSYIYFDSEWKPSVCGQSKLSLLQIAVGDHVFLVDCLSTELDSNMWQALGAIAFNNVNIMKIGFSIQHDLIMLQNSLPLQLRIQTPCQYLDLNILWKYLKNLPNPIQLPYGNIANSGESLTDLTTFCLGKKLDKSNQCSNWANRPLRNDQILYAALDARCLLLIYKTLVKTLLEHRVNIDVIIEKVIELETTSLLKRFSNLK